MIKTNLGSIAEIKFGLYDQPEESGPAIYLQVRQFSEDGLLVDQENEFIQLDSKNESHILNEGDVLFVGKGSRLFAWVYHDNKIPTVASSIFFVIKPDLSVIIPDYLAAILNAPQSKKTFHQLGGGTNIFSIRKSELAAFNIPIRPIEQQKQIAELAKLHRQEIAFAKALIEKKQDLYTAIISKLTK